MAFQYKHVLVIGATSGIGRGMADHFIAQGMKVTAVGRRQDRLDEFVVQHGSDQASAIAFDIAKLDEIPAFIKTTFEQHPTIDSVMLNAGTEARANFSKPETVDLAAFHRAVTINFTSHVSLVHAILPHLLARDAPTSLLFTGTQVSLVPVYVMPGYSASKAALDAFIMCLREQLRDTNVKVQHISPGPVQTELHDAEMGDAGRNFGMPMEEFMSDVWTGLTEGKLDIFPGTLGGSTKEQFLEIVRVRDEATDRMTGLMRMIMGQ